MASGRAVRTERREHPEGVGVLGGGPKGGARLASMPEAALLALGVDSDPVSCPLRRGPFHR